jgi:site-specific DNA recombinase
VSNRYYTGVVTFKGLEYQGRHQPLIPEGLFQQVQDVLSLRRNGEKDRKHRHYLRSTVYCGQCGDRFGIMVAKGIYEYFFCIGRQTRRTACTQSYLPVEVVEAAVERYYATVRLPEHLQIRIRDGLRAELDQQQLRAAPERAQERKRTTELEEERRRLGRAVVTGSIPADIAREEQARIRTELRHAQQVLAATEMVYGRIADALNQALELVGRCDEVYRLGGPRTRRLSNQFFFEKLLVTDDEPGTAQVVGAILCDPWATMLTEEFQSQMAHNTKNPDRDLDGRGSKMSALVPPAGIEPATHGLGNRCSIP